MPDYSPAALKEEITIECSVAWGVFLFRLYSRYVAHGVRAYGWDDSVMFQIMCLYSANLFLLHYIAAGPGGSVFHPYELKYFSQTEIASRSDGSKWVQVSEQLMLHIIWGCKVCLLYFYKNLTEGSILPTFQRYLRAWVILGYMMCQMAYFLQCRPFRGYWDIPSPEPDCTTFFSYAIVNALANISSDLIMIVVPVYVIGTADIPLREQAGISFIFCLGIFVVVAALLTKVFNLSDPYDTLYMFWYARESSVAIYVANLPMIWPWVRRHVPVFRTSSYGMQKSFAHEKKKPSALKLRPQVHIRVVNGQTFFLTDAEVRELDAQRAAERAGGLVVRESVDIDGMIDSLFDPSTRSSGSGELVKDKDV